MENRIDYFGLWDKKNMKHLEKGIKDTPVEIPKWINENKIKFVITTDYKTGHIEIETDDVRWINELKKSGFKIITH